MISGLGVKGRLPAVLGDEMRKVEALAGPTLQEIDRCTTNQKSDTNEELEGNGSLALLEPFQLRGKFTVAGDQASVLSLEIFDHLSRICDVGSIGIFHDVSPSQNENE